MGLIPLVVLLKSSEAVTIATRIEAAHQRMAKGGILISDGLTNIIPTKLKLGQGACILALPNQQIVEVKANNIRFFDQIFNQVASVKPAKTLKVPDSAASVAMVQREPITWFVDSAQRKEFFTEVKRDPRWTVKGTSLLLVDAKKKLRSEVHFDSSYRVTNIKLVMNSKTLTDWRYRYVAETEVPPIPATAKAVKGLPQRPAMPTATKGPAILLSQKIWRFLSRLEGKTIVQETEEETYTTTLSKGQLVEKNGQISWSVNDTKLKMNLKSGPKTATGGGDQLLNVLRGNSIDPSPVARYVMGRRIPFLDLFDRTSEVVVDGIVSVDGKPKTLLTLKRPGAKIRMYVDEKTGEIAMISSDTQAFVGEGGGTSKLKLSYR